MKKFLYILFISIVLLILSCSWNYDYDIVIAVDNDEPKIGNSVRDSLNVGIRLIGFPYSNDYIKIDCDSFYHSDKLVVYRNSHIYVDIYGDYIISDINWLSNDMDNKTIQLVSKAQEQVYWCGSDIALDSLNIKLVKRIKELSE
jgi:hypothetical protein